MKEAKYRMEDALNATRAAVSEGIIAGGGSAYVHAQEAVMKLADTLEGDEKTGAVIVAKALEAPLRTIVENAGLEGAVVVDKVREQEKGIGFDAVNETYVDMMDVGIIDPVKVTKNALTNAVSISATLLTTEAAVGDIKENKPEASGNNVDMGY
jgi:chaperonin GroEL